jgi:predicted porin
LIKLFALSTLAVLTLVCPLISNAQSTGSTVLYGTIDQFAGYIHSSSGEHITALSDGALLRSRIGVRGTEPLQPGYAVIYDLEAGISADTGGTADSSRLFDRQAWVGITTPMGEWRFGRQNTDIFFIGGAIDYTARTTYGSIVNTFGAPFRFDNDVSFKSPRWRGLQLGVHYAMPESTPLTGRHTGVIQLALNYQTGPWRAGYAGLQASPDRATALVSDKIRYHNAYLNYRYDRGTLYAAAVHSNNSTVNANGLNAGTILNNVSISNNDVAGTDLAAGRYYNVWQLSADYRITPAWRVGALAGVIHDTTGGHAGARGCNVGALYSLSARTTLYGFASYMRNEEHAGFRFSGSAAPSSNLAGNAVNGRSLTGLQLGILHIF